MRKIQTTVMLITTLVILSVSVIFAAPPKPKITPKQADAAALKHTPGTIVSTKYEFEDNRWQYAVIVKNKKGYLYELEVSATTGAVLDSERTSAAEEAKEAAADAHKSGKAK